MTRYAIIDIRNSPMTVVDIIEVDDLINEETGQPTETLRTSDFHLAIVSADAEIGWSYNGELIASGS